jgi:uncharacterized protein (TIGR00661 family)
LQAKILYAIQGTGNGHSARAIELLPFIKKYGQVDLLIAGAQHQLFIEHQPTIKTHGLGFTFGKKGGVNYWDTFKNFKLLTFTKDFVTFPIKKYDVVLNDFEPLTAWLTNLKGMKSTAISHHAAYLSPKTPRPEKRNWLIEKVLKYHSQCYYTHAFHFQKYDTFIHTPIIKQKIRIAEPSTQNFVLVYLPSMSPDFFYSLVSNFQEQEFKFFSSYVTTFYQKGNVHFYPINNEQYSQFLVSCAGLICNAGFESPAEALYLGKKLLCMPVLGQYEQYCNAQALMQLGVDVVLPNKIKPEILKIEIAKWLSSSKHIRLNFEDNAAQIVKKAFSNYGITP